MTTCLSICVYQNLIHIYNTPPHMRKSILSSAYVYISMAAHVCIRAAMLNMCISNPQMYISICTSVLMYTYVVAYGYVHMPQHMCTYRAYVHMPQRMSYAYIDTRLHMYISTWQRPDRGIYTINGGRSLYCLHFGLSQFMGPEAYPSIFVPVLLRWLSNRSLY